MQIKEDKIQELLKMCRAGMSDREIAKEIGCNHKTVRRYRELYNIPGWYQIRAANLPSVVLVKQTESGANICFDCKKALGRCEWSDQFKPISGWTAVKTKRGGYHIMACPKFERG